MSYPERGLLCHPPLDHEATVSDGSVPHVAPGRQISLPANAIRINQGFMLVLRHNARQGFIESGSHAIAKEHALHDVLPGHADALGPVPSPAHQPRLRPRLRNDGRCRNEERLHFLEGGWRRMRCGRIPRRGPSWGRGYTPAGRGPQNPGDRPSEAQGAPFNGFQDVRSWFAPAPRAPQSLLLLVERLQ